MADDSNDLQNTESPPPRSASDTADSHISADATVQFEKSNFFRMIFVDGAEGEISRDGETFRLSIFSERMQRGFQIPLSISAEKSERQQVGMTPISFLIQEHEADLVMSFRTAASIAATILEGLSRLGLVKYSIEPTSQDDDLDADNRGEE